MKTPSMFLFLTIIMAVLALLFIVLPVVLRNRKATTSTWVVTTVVPILAISLYVLLGRPDGIDQASPQHFAERGNSSNSDGSKPAAGIASVSSLISGLEERLAADPTDAKGWLLLAKSYSHLGRGEDAAAAYAKARDLGQMDRAFEASVGANNSERRTSPVIHGRLTIAEHAKDLLDPDDSIFIFAKSTEGAAIPVAVLRKNASDLPFDFELSDKQAMSVSANLSATTTVIVTARVSKSGNAMQAEPGLEVVSQAIDVRNTGLIELHLDPAQAANGS